MLNLQPVSQGTKTKGCATTYRSGEGNAYATCPNTCPLKPDDWKGSDDFDLDYMTALSKAVPKGGWSWTYSHFMPMLWQHLLGKGKTVINASASSKDQAAQYMKQGIPTVLDVPPDTPKNFVHEGVQFNVCPAVLSKKMTCNNCGGLICYGNGYRVKHTWNKFADKPKQHLSDGEKLLAEVKLLPYYTRLRHHIVGDGGAEA